MNTSRPESEASARVIVRVDPRAVLAVLLTCIALLTAAGLFVVVMRFGFDHGRLLGFSARFDLNLEGNVPTHYSALQLAFAALMLAVIARAKRTYREPFARHWLVLCAIFAFLSFDEAAQVHEWVRKPMLAQFELTGVWAYAWFIPYGILVTLFLAAYWRFYWHLRTPIRALFATACAIYVAAAIGVELVQLHFMVAPEYGPSRDLYVAVSSSVEECLEMLGIATFIYALLRYTAERMGVVLLEFSPAQRR